jgi:carboxymethylenebutenolidase
MSGEWINIAATGIEVRAWRAAPQDARRGGVVVLQEIFGVNANIREICSDFAEHGYEAIAPALFERVAPGFETLDVNDETMAKGRAYVAATPMDAALADCQACVDYLSASGKVFMAGFCYGGSLAWMSAQHLKGLSAVSSFYGRLIPDYLDSPLQVPLIAHFGKNDPSIPIAGVEKVMQAFPEAPVHLYNAGHSFMRKGGSYVEDAAKLAWLRTLQLFQRNAASKEDF